MFRTVWMPVVVIAALLCLPPARAQDAPKILTSLSADQAEKLLKARNLDCKRTEDKGVAVFSFKKDGIDMAFYVYGGKDIMLDAVFPPMPIQVINDWNIAVKWSRACLKQEGKALVSVLEWNLDLRPGVTDKAIDHFFSSFEREAQNFQQLTKPRVYTKLAADNLETMLKFLKIDFTKAAVKDGGFSYDYEVGNHKVRLYYVNPQELMIDAHFKAIPLEKANAYNLQKKFLRVAVYTQGDDTHTALQANLDLAGGVSDGIVQHFLLAFEEEVRGFQDYVRKLK